MTDPADSPLRYAEPRGGPPDTLSTEERSVLDTVNRKIAGSPSLDKVIDFVFQSTRSVLPCDRLSVAFLEESGQRLRSHYTVADYQPVLLGKGYAEDLRGSSLAEVIARGVPRVISDLERYAREHPASQSTRLVLREGIRSSMTCPLSVEGRQVGVMFRSSRRPNVYTEHHVRLHRVITGRLGQAVEKAYRIEQLESANAAYFEMLGFVSHELKSPVASMVSDAQLLTEGYLGELDPAQSERVERMIAKGKYLLGLVGEYLDLARIEGGELEFEFRPISDFAGEVIDPALEVVTPHIEEKGMRLDRELPAEAVAAQCDPGLMKIVLVNLLGNAAKYGAEGGAIRIRLAREEGDLSVAVWNEGPGFPVSERGKLFRKFSRIKTPELMKQKGTGVGLYTAWRIVTGHGGRITAASDPGHWAEFTFRIPQPPRRSATAGCC